MSRSASLIVFLTVSFGLAGLTAVTAPALLARTRLGLEFRGGYEIYYLASPLDGRSQVTQEELRRTAELLRKRADGIGMSEPDIRVEGANHIRLKVAGLTSADQVRTVLGAPTGLPTRLTERYTQTVGSVLGASALHETVTAGLIGTGLVVLLLLALYRLAGLVATLGLVTYLWLLLGVFNTLHATLSLSAVVAFVLGIGMAADASIIAFSRICEELRRAGDREAAIRAGFRASFRTIRDANVVTAIAMLALFAAGIGPIQGFALTMLASLVVSVLTNLLLIRFLVVRLAEARAVPIEVLIRQAPSAPRAEPRAPDFLRAGRALAVASMVVIAAGGWYYARHGLNLDIDFTAGTALDLDLDGATTLEEATGLMSDAGTVPATVAIGAAGRHVAARFDEILTPADLDPIITAFKARFGSGVTYEENTADPGTAREFALRAIYALAAACAGIVVFVGWSFSWPVAVATLVSIAHDLLLVSAIFALFRLEIDVTYVAAMLTVMGYSLNDKIVIFGRVRDNISEARGSGAAGDAVPVRQRSRSIANRSIRQTLGRSVSTVLTVVMASAALYAFACEPLQMFALAILIGLISGAVSSIFLACPLWLRLRTPRRGAEAALPRL